MNTTHPIDFVITWVDGSDPDWQVRKAKYTGTKETEGNTKARYRDWDTLKYWFRGVEKFAPWVRYIHFVTDDQKPDWLNLDHPKLKWVKHTDYIPKEYLPTFSTNPIELNLHRIKDLSEHFVYFNDDIFLIKATMPEDFFVDGLPCDLPRLGVLYPTDFFSYMIFNNGALINRHFSLNNSIMRNMRKWIKAQPISNIIRLIWYGRQDWISVSVNPHIHVCMNKSTYKTLWEVETEALHNTCMHKQRNREDITDWCIRDWQLLSGEFHPKKPIGKAFSTDQISKNNKAINYLRKQKGKVICLNDCENEEDFETHKQMIIDAFEKILSEKSEFEL